MKKALFEIENFENFKPENYNLKSIFADLRNIDLDYRVTADSEDEKFVFLPNMNKLVRIQFDRNEVIMAVGVS